MSTSTKPKLPYGSCNFEKIRTEGYYYVDKTRFIEMLENEQNDKLFFTRPRKFGKSLFINTLIHYYDLCDADKFKQLFGDLYIGQHPTPKHNSLMVLKFDFSGIDTSSEAAFRESFHFKVEMAIRGLILNYLDIFPHLDVLLNDLRTVHPGVKAVETAIEVAKSVGRKLFIIIDEYDHFANDLIAMGSAKGDDLYHQMLGANGLVRDFYETIKAGSGDTVDRVFLTGITPIMLDDMTSGFNVTHNISLKEQYSEILGFTAKEVEEIMRVVGLSKEQFPVDIETFYDGYLFHPDAVNRVYNPAMIFYFFNEILNNPRDVSIIDDNLKMDYGRLSRLFANDDNRSQLIKIAETGGIAGNIKPKFRLKELSDSQNFTSLLYYMGLLTIDNSQSGKTLLRIPNFSIRTAYWEYLQELLRDRNEKVQPLNHLLVDSMYHLAYEGVYQPFFEYISNNVVSRLSNRDLMNFDEKYLKILMLTQLFQSQYYIPMTEMEVSTGYPDIYLIRTQRFYSAPYEWVWEVKYIRKKDEKNVELIEQKRNEARTQLAKYKSSQLFADRTDVRYLSVVFIGKNKVELEEVVCGQPEQADRHGSSK